MAPTGEHSMTKQLCGVVAFAAAIVGGWPGEASACWRRCGCAPSASVPYYGGYGNSAVVSPAANQAGRETWYGVAMYEANGQYAGSFENPGYENVVNQCNGWKSGGQGRTCGPIYTVEHAPRSQAAPADSSSARSVFGTAYAPQGSWGQ